MANGFRPGVFESDGEYDFVEDLSTWEFIIPSDDDVEDHYSLDEEYFVYDDGEEEDKNNVVVDDAVIGPKEDGPSAIGPPSSDISMQALSEPVLLNGLRYLLDHHVLDEIELRYIDGMYALNGGNDGDNDEDDGDGYYDDEYDLDDELVPRFVRCKFGRERMKKVGKREYPRMNKSKKLPYFYNRPGCVHGKHGLGVKHTCI